MTTTKPTRLRIAAALGLLAVIGAAFAVVPWRIGDGPLRSEIERRLKFALDAPDAEFGRMSLVLLPTPRLRLNDVRFSSKDGSLHGVVPLTKVSLRISPLVRGVAKPANATLVNPKILVRLPDTPEQLSLPGSQNLKSLTRYLVNQGSLGGLPEVAIEKGSVTLRSGVTGAPVTQIDGLMLQASLASRKKPFKISAAGRLGHDPFRFSFSGASPAALSASQREPISASFHSASLIMEFSGNGMLAGNAAAKGNVTVRVNGAQTPLDPVLRTLGFEAVGAAVLRATIDSSASGATLSDLSIVSGDKRFDGVGALRHDGNRWHVNATLATARLDMNPVLSSLKNSYSQELGWQTNTINSDPLFATNVDVRLSADRVVVGSGQISQAALAFLSRAGRVEATLGDGVYEGGRAKARVTVSRAADGLEFKMSGAVVGFNLGTAATAAGFARRISGTANAEFELESGGTNASEFISRLDGRLSATARNGEMFGIDLLRLANKKAGKSELLLTEMLGGTTAFETAGIHFRAMKGLVQPVEGSMQAGRLVGALAGRIDLPSGEISLGGNVVQIQNEGSGTGEPRPILDFSVTGPLGEPRIMPNVTALLKRS